MASLEERAEANQAFADRMRNGVSNLTAPPEVHDEWVDWLQASAFDGVWLALASSCANGASPRSRC